MVLWNTNFDAQLAVGIRNTTILTGATPGVDFTPDESGNICLTSLDLPCGGAASRSLDGGHVFQ